MRQTGLQQREGVPAVRGAEISRPFDEIVARVLVTMTNEIAALMEDGIAARASDADLVLVNGYGFPRHEGGPVFWARRQDRAWLLAQLAGLRDTTGYGFRAGDVERLLDQRDE